MAEDINPTQPISPSLPVNPPPDDKRRQQPKNKKTPDTDKDQEQHEQSKERPHKGLFDEYV